jgi:hypothetical protein
LAAGLLLVHVRHSGRVKLRCLLDDGVGYIYDIMSFVTRHDSKEITSSNQYHITISKMIKLKKKKKKKNDLSSEWNSEYDFIFRPAFQLKARIWTMI